MITCICTSKCPDDWDMLLNKAGGEANFLQSEFWSHLICTLDEAVPHYFRVIEGSNVLAQALFLQRWSYDRINKRKLCSVSCLECYDGPVILRTDRKDEVIRHILDAASFLAKKTCSSNTTIVFSHTSSCTDSHAVENLFRKQKFILEKWATVLVDIAPDTDTLFMSISHAARKCIKKCWRQGITIERIESYHDFQNTFMTNYNLMAKSLERATGDCTLTPPEDWNKYYRFFLAREDDVVLGGLGMFFFNGVATEVQSIISVEAYERKIPVQDLLHWELILEAKRLGCHTFDLAGFNPNPSSEKEEGIARFKSKWGGRTVVYNIFSKAPFNIRSFLHRIAARAISITGLRNFVRSIFRT
jgi:hypothetical protein